MDRINVRHNNGNTRERERVCERKHKPTGAVIYRLCRREQLMDPSNKNVDEKTTLQYT